MNLLILTQKIDINDDLLGFFHNWIKKLSEQFSKITVICLQKGSYNLPDKVSILSLGKELYLSYPYLIRKLLILYRFYKFIWLERQKYEAVFVHMNPIYIVLAGWLWRLWHKKIVLWYIHPKSDLKLKISHIFVDKILSATPQTFPIKSRKLIPVGHGIDLSLFQEIPNNKPKNSILYVGRISPIKNLEILAQAANELHYKNIDFTLTFIGERDKYFPNHYEEIRKMLNHLENIGKVKFLNHLPYKMMPQAYNQHEILVNLTESGSFDKAVLEAMACGSLVLVFNKAFEKILPREFIIESKKPKELEKKLIWIFNLSPQQKEHYSAEFKKYITENHNLDNLAIKIKNVFLQIN